MKHNVKVEYQRKEDKSPMLLHFACAKLDDAVPAAIRIMGRNHELKEGDYMCLHFHVPDSSQVKVWTFGKPREKESGLKKDEPKEDQVVRPLHRKDVKETEPEKPVGKTQAAAPDAVLIRRNMYPLRRNAFVRKEAQNG